MDYLYQRSRLTVLSVIMLVSFISLLLPKFALADEFVNWESPHVHPLDKTPDDSTLLAVNTANHTLEVFDIESNGLSHRVSIPVGLDPVSVRARNNNEVWVVNQVSDSVSIVDLTRSAVIETIQTDDEPADVIFAPSNQRAFVSCSQANSVLVYSTESPLLSPTRLEINGEDPRALAISPDGQFVYATIFESGNQTTILAGGRGSNDPGNVIDDARGPYGGVNPPPNNGSGFLPSINSRIGVPPRVGLIVRKNENAEWMDDNNGDWTNFISGELSSESRRVSGWDMPDRDVAIINTQTLEISYHHGVMNVLMAAAVNPATGALTVVGTDAINHIRYEPNIRSKFIEVKFAHISVDGDQTTADMNPHLADGIETVPLANRRESIGDPRGIAWEQSGEIGYVTGLGSNNMIVIDKFGQRLSNVDPIVVGEGPTGLVLEESSDRAFVLNKFEGSISIVDTNTLSELSKVAFFDPTPAEIKDGRAVLYNTHESSGRGQISCASCHVDARHDRLAWDLGNPAGEILNRNGVQYHPMKGPMRTTSLIGIIGSPLLHFRGDRNNILEFDNAFHELQGLETPMDQNNMRVLEGFLETILTPPNPYRSLNNTMPTQIQIPGSAGRVGNPRLHTGQNNCLPCHSQATNARDGVVRPTTGNFAGPQPAIAPSLRSMYEVLGLYYDNATESNAGFGFIHDGSFDENTQGTLQNNNNLAFMLALNGDLPGDTHAAVGKQITLNEQTPNADLGMLSELLNLADASAIGLVAKGIYNNQSREFLYLGNRTYQSDTLSDTFTHTHLLAATSQPDNVLTFTAVPFDSKVRIGIDRDNDGILNGDDTTNELPRSVSIVNGGFEAQIFSNSGFALNNITGWNVQSSRAGVWNVHANSYSQEAPQGANVAFIDNGGTISQTLQETLQADTALRLSVLVGDERSGAESSAWSVRLYAGGQLLGSINNSDFNPANDSFIDATLQLSASQLDAFSTQIGQPLIIELFDAGNAENVHFDDIRLLAINDSDTDEGLPVPTNNLIQIDGNDSDWLSIVSSQDIESENTSPVDFETAWLTSDNDKVYLAYRDRQAINLDIFWTRQALIDSDYDAETGFRYEATGGDYLLVGDVLYRYDGTGEDWQWKLIEPITSSINDKFAEFAIDRSILGQSDKFRITLYGANTFAGGLTNDFLFVDTESENNTAIIKIDGNIADWSSFNSYQDTPGENTSPVDIEIASLTSDADKVYLAYRDRQAINPDIFWAWQALIDSDYNAETGFHYEATGGDYLLMGGELYRYAGTGEDWQWNLVGSVTSSINGNFAEFAIERSILGQSDKFRLTFYGANTFAGGLTNDFFFVDTDN